MPGAVRKVEPASIAAVSSTKSCIGKTMAFYSHLAGGFAMQLNTLAFPIALSILATSGVVRAETPVPKPTPKGADADERIVCRREQATSWRTTAPKICMPLRAWKASELDARDLARKIRERSNIPNLPPSN
ncbi:hypothetical protein [Novosphingobium sp. Gsoil 351]|uniref:hypothetical protein n=1 Tax=Novosphingobium sp. Gsoil 351 TaxID=2675225 RepID=UPI0012B4AFC2|nr:hypothetical protein [Novosphingobium sp. Gsoil 351]QGN53894.1 hypothetical protein GKE62_04445 [Novosphingobium sp. Gsoil 351]